MCRLYRAVYNFYANGGVTQPNDGAVSHGYPWAVGIDILVIHQQAVGGVHIANDQTGGAQLYARVLARYALLRYRVVYKVGVSAQHYPALLHQLRKGDELLPDLAV